MYVLNVEDRHLNALDTAIQCHVQVATPTYNSQLSHRIKCICKSFHHVSTLNLESCTSSNSTDSYRFPIPLQMELAVDNFARLRLSVFPRMSIIAPCHLGFN